MMRFEQWTQWVRPGSFEANLGRLTARFNFLFRGGVFWFGIAAYLVGVVTLIFGTVLSVLYLIYRWLRDGVWQTNTLADLLSGKNSLEGSWSWTLDMPLLVAMPAIGSILVVAGIAICVGAHIAHREDGESALV